MIGMQVVVQDGGRKGVQTTPPGVYPALWGASFLVSGVIGVPTWGSLKFRGIESKLFQPSDKLILEIVYGGVTVFGS
jgi:hypothetical protein